MKQLFLTAFLVILLIICLSRVIHIDRLFTESSVEILKGCLLATSQKYLGVTVTDDGICIVFVDRF